LKKKEDSHDIGRIGEKGQPTGNPGETGAGAK
jgi:hypothetical protein